MNVAAIAVGVGALCLASTGGPQAAPVPLFSGPVFVTASGFVNRVAALEVLRTVELPFTMDSDVGYHVEGRGWPKAGSYKTLVIVPGFDSTQAEEFDTGAELNRIRALIAQARKANASILLLHVGGNRSRGSSRGSRRDDSNLLAAKSADYMMVAGDGNQDGFFTVQAAKRGIPVEAVSGIADAGDALTRLFKVGPRVSAGSVGSVLPPLRTSRTPDGSTLDFGSLRGRWTALHFWTTASNEIRSLRTYQAKYGERVQFVGVAVDSREYQWKRTIDDLPANWWHVLNGTGSEDLATQFDVHVLPLRFLIDPSGKVAGRFAQYQDTYINVQWPDQPPRVGTFFTRLDELFKAPINAQRPRSRD